MPKKLFALLTVTALAFSLFAAKNKDKEEDRRDRKLSRISYYSLENAPETMEIRARRGESITFHLEENPTTGYVWEAKYDKKHCKVDLKQRASKAKRVGAPGLVEVKLKLDTSRDTVVELVYRRPFEKGVKPIKTIRCHLVHSNYDGDYYGFHKRHHKKPKTGKNDSPDGPKDSPDGQPEKPANK